MRRKRRGPEIGSNKHSKFCGKRKEEKKEVAEKSQIKQPESLVDMGGGIDPQQRRQRK